MAATRELLTRRPDRLHLVCVPTAGLQVDLLIGAGVVATVETSAVSLGEAGPAPRFVEAVRAGTIRVLDATCPAIHAGLTAAQKGVPFMPIRGLIGSDVLRHRPDWQVIPNPLSDRPDPIVVIPAITPDVCLFHAPLADREGNVQIGRRRELATMAYAARRTLVTVERLTDTSLLADEASAAGVLPSLYVEAVAEAPRGAWPYGLWGHYPSDADWLARYAAAAREPAGFRTMLAAFLQGGPDP
jgi:glutaconate CoA-transferase subunit A